MSLFWPEQLSIVSLTLFSLIVATGLFLSGYPILRWLKSVRNTGLVEKFCLSVFLGMALLVIVSSLASIIGPFLYPVLYGLPIIGIIFFILDCREGVKINISWKGLLKQILPLVLLLIVAFFSFNAISGLVGSTDADEAYHTFFIHFILSNARVVDRPLPSYNFLLYNPPGPHIIGAFSTTIASYPIEKVVISLSALFVVMTALGIYTLCYALFKRIPVAMFAVILAFFAGQFWWPLAFTFTIQIMAFSIFAAVTLLWRTFRVESMRKNVIITGLILAFTFFIHPALPVYIATFILSFLVVSAVKWRPSRRQAVELAVGLFSVIGLTALLSSPFLATLIEFLKNSTSGLPADWIAPSLRSTYAPVSPHLYYPLTLFINPFQMSNLAAQQGALLYIGPLSILFVLMFFIIWYVIPRSQEKIDLKVREKWFSLMRCIVIFFLWFEFILIFTELAYYVTVPSILGLPAFALSYLADPLRDVEMLYIPLIILTCAAIYTIISIPTLFPRTKCTINKLRWPSSASLKGFITEIDRKVLVCAFFCAVIVFQLVSSAPIGISNYSQAPLQEYSAPAALVKGYSLLTADDLAMFRWIEVNTSQNAVFLVSEIDTGQYLTAVTGRLSIYPYEPIGACAHYRLLQFAMEINPSNPYIAGLLSYYNISYVFIGSKEYNPNLSTWSLIYMHYAIFNASLLMASPFFELVKNFGNAWLFKVNTNSSFTEEGPCITTLVDSSIITSNSSIGSWTIRLGTEIFNTSQDWVTASFNYRLWGLFSFNRPVDFTNVTQIALCVRSSSSREYSLLLYDKNNDYRYWTFNASDTWSLIVMNLSAFDGGSPQNLALSNVTRIEIDSPVPTNASTNIVTDFGPVFLVKSITFGELSEQYSSPSASPQMSLTLPGAGMYTVLVPSFLQPIESGFPAGTFQILPSSDLLVNVTTDQPRSLPFEFSSIDPRILMTSYVSRPLRYITFQAVNSWSNASLFTLGEDGPLATPILGTQLDIPWDEAMFKLSNLDLSNGTLMLGVFVNGSTVGSPDAVINVYNGYPNPSKLIGQFYLQNTQRWFIFSTTLNNIKDLYVSIENLGMVGQFYLEPLIYSSNPFY
jgi:hypothetical protein